jgi:hypothetical protein
MRLLFNLRNTRNLSKCYILSTVLVFIFLSSFISDDYPKDITGEWIVDYVDVSKLPANLTAKQKAAVNKSLVEPLKNAVFNFKPDYHFSLSATFANMPTNDFWAYDKEDGIISIKEYNDLKSMVMQIKILEKDDKIYFCIQETPVVLTMHKKEE